VSNASDCFNTGKSVIKVWESSHATAPIANEHERADDMRLNLLLPEVKPEHSELPKRCPRSGWKGKRCSIRQGVKQKLVDAKYPDGEAWRCQGAACGHTFRVSPQGVSKQHISQRVSGLAVMRYVLGRRYGAVARVLERLGRGMGKTRVYRAVQAVAENVPSMKQRPLCEGDRTEAGGAEVTGVRWKGPWLMVGIGVDAMHGLTVRIDRLLGEEAAPLNAWLEPMLHAGEADVLGTDDAAACKTVREKTGRAHQGWKTHVRQHTAARVAHWSAWIRAGNDHSLEPSGRSPEQALADLDNLSTRSSTRNPDDQQALEHMSVRAAKARTPANGQAFAGAYRMRNRVRDRWTV